MSPGAADSRDSRSCVGRSRGRRRQAEYVGDDGLGGTQHRGDQRRQVEVALACGTYDVGEDLLGVGALTGAVAAAHLADDDGGSDGLFGAPVGGVDRRVPQEREDGGEFAGQMGGKALGVVVRRRLVDQPAEPGEQSARGRWPRPWSLRPPASRRSRSARPACKVSCTLAAHPQWG